MNFSKANLSKVDFSNAILTKSNFNKCMMDQIVFGSDEKQWLIGNSDGHTGHILCLAISPDGSSLLSSARDG